MSARQASHEQANCLATAAGEGLIAERYSVMLLSPECSPIYICVHGGGSSQLSPESQAICHLGFSWVLADLACS